MSGSGWYYVENDARIGPVERSELERLISQGSVTAQTMVWREGMSGWEEAARHFTISGVVGGPPPVMPSRPAAAMAAPAGAGYSTGHGGLYAGAPARGFGEAVSVCFSKYASFSGRASRSEYWYFVLFNFLVGLVTGVLDVTIFGLENELSPINTVASLVLFLPSLAAGVRRLHDTNRSGWWYGWFFIALVGISVVIGVMVASNPYAVDDAIGLFAILGIGGLIYGIVLLVFMCQRGDPGPNRFG